MKKGSKVILHLFTGLATSVLEIKSVTKDTITVIGKTGKEMVFDKKTLKQIDPAPKQPRFANYITEDDGSFAPKRRGRKKKVPEWTDIEEDEYEEIE